MDRRVFVLGLLAAAGSAAAPPALAHSRHRSTDCGLHLLHSARLALKRSRRFVRGLSIEVAASPAIAVHKYSRRPSRHDPLVELVSSLEISVGSHAHRRLERNIRRFEERWAESLDRHERSHFHDHWQHDRWTTFETREHLEDCKACRRSLHLLIHDTELDLIPVLFEDEVTVVAPSAGPQPQRPLHLPKIPDGMRSALRGKSLVLRAEIDRHGRAEVVGVRGRGFSDFVVQRAVDMVERQAWNPSRRGCAEDVRIRFQW